MIPFRGPESGRGVAHALQQPSSSVWFDALSLTSYQSTIGNPPGIRRDIRGTSKTSENAGRPAEDDICAGLKGGMIAVRFDRNATYTVLMIVMKSLAGEEVKKFDWLRRVIT